MVNRSKALVTAEGRNCNNCLKFKIWGDFNKHSKGLKGYRATCIECRKVYGKILRSLPSDKLKRKEYRLNVRYGITLKEYGIMLKEQNYSCKICSLPEAEHKCRLHVDHCHETGKIRGLLCVNCNSFLGKARDSIELLSKAITYLKEER